MIEPVYFEDDAIDLVGEIITLAGDVVVVVLATIHAFDDRGQWRHPHTPFLEFLEYLALTGRQSMILVIANSVGIELQRSRRRDSRVELAQRSRRSISRINESLDALPSEPRIERSESSLGNIYLTADFEPLWKPHSAESQRHGFDGSYVVSDVLACLSIAARGSAHEFPVLVKQAYGGAIELRLG